MKQITMPLEEYDAEKAAEKEAHYHAGVDDTLSMMRAITGVELHEVRHYPQTCVRYRKEYEAWEKKNPGINFYVMMRGKIIFNHVLFEMVREHHPALLDEVTKKLKEAHILGPDDKWVV